MWLDAKPEKVERDERVVSAAAVIVMWVREIGRREVLEFDLGTSEDEVFWLAFLSQLVARTCRTQLVTCDIHEGLKGVIQFTLQGTRWKR